MNSKEKKQLARLSPEAQARVMSADRCAQSTALWHEMYALKSPAQQAAQDASVAGKRRYEERIESAAANSDLANDYKHAEADINRDIAYMRAKAGDRRFNRLSKF